MPKKTVKTTLKIKNKRKSKRSYKKLKGGTVFPTVDNVIPYNENLGLRSDPLSPISQISGRNWVGGKKRRLSKKFMRKLKMEMKKKGGSIFNYDLLTGASFQDNAVQSINTSSGTQNTLDKIIGNPQETGPTMSYDKMPDSALV
jgi:hypothetical protein